MIGIIESGNSGNVHRALRHIGYETETYDRSKTYSALVMPGVGHFGAYMRALPVEEVRSHIEAGRKALAICVGMQALYQGSEEAFTPGLGLIPGTCKLLTGRVPRVGWSYVEEWSSFFYFTHSFSAGVDWVRYKNTLGVQFHVEKSGAAGLKMLGDFFS